MDEVLVAENVRKAYGDTVALDGVNLHVAEGEVFGLIGPNGAGKTTLIRSLTGTTNAEGTIRVLGTGPKDADPQRIGLLPQSFNPPERLTARELIDYYGGLYDEARDTESVLEDVGLADDADTWYENLSGGQQRRVCVGSSLVNDPELLFLDEPTTAIDPAGRRALWALIEDLAAGGTTIFLTSHSMDEVEELAHRVGLLNDGQIAAVGTPEDLISEYGGESRLLVRASGGVDALRENGFDVETVGDELVVRDLHPTRIGHVVEVLEGVGVEYESLTWKEPGLEEVYLSLTGDSFEGERGTARPAVAAVGGEQ